MDKEIKDMVVTPVRKALKLIGAARETLQRRRRQVVKLYDLKTKSKLAGDKDTEELDLLKIQIASQDPILELEMEDFRQVQTDLRKATCS